MTHAELDRLVAERVFGCTTKETPRMSSGPSVVYCTCAPSARHEGWPEWGIPAFSSGGFGLMLLKRHMNELGWWFSMRDAGNGTDFDAIFFWAKNWRREGRARGPMGSEPFVVAQAAIKALKAPEVEG